MYIEFNPRTKEHRCNMCSIQGIKIQNTILERGPRPVYLIGLTYSTCCMLNQTAEGNKSSSSCFSFDFLLKEDVSTTS